MDKTIYACGCYIIKDGSVNNFVQFCAKHQSSYDPTASVDTMATTVVNFSESVVTVALAEGQRRIYS